MGEAAPITEKTRKTRKAPLTVAKVKTAQPGKYHDGLGHGLFLRVDPNLSRFWVQRVVINGKRREIGLGSFPIVSLAEARSAALKNKQLTFAGLDPLAERRKARTTLTFADAAARYMIAKGAELQSEKSRKIWRSTMDAYAIPKIGSLPVNAIDVQDVLRVLQPIWSEKTETASRLRGRIESVLSWATVAGHRTGDNPARWGGNLAELLGKPSKVGERGNRPALAQADVPRWFAALADLEGMPARALQFAALCASRSGEVRGATWDEIDLPNAVWVIPGSRMKMGREHRVPLSTAALAVLNALPRMAGTDLVFFSLRGGQLTDSAISNLMRAMHQAEVDAQRPGYLDPSSKRPAVPHGLRSAFRVWAAESGVDYDLGEAALAHSIGTEVQRAYQRSDVLERRRVLMENWAACLHGQIGSGTVVPLRAVN